ncbi:hypothetical protein MMC14_006808 [Varicellaria rhodocarpa]|nr:hypothetical protein [Varicellaria rhodocarpa]
MPNDDLKTYATGTTDFYQLLGIFETCSQRDLDRAWRKTALRYHPDKTGADPVAREKFHLAQIGYDILSDPTIKSLYDNARNTREQKKRQNALFEGKRKTMKEKLENRERGVKRGREEQEGDEERFEREVRRLAEDGKRRRKEREDALRREVQEQNESSEANTTAVATPAKATPSAPGVVPEISRTIKIRFSRSNSTTPTKESLISLFSTFGHIENAFLLKDKKKKKKRCTGFIVYTSIVGAHAAISDVKQKDGLEDFDVDWAEARGTERDRANDPETPVRTSFGSAPSTPGSGHSFTKAGCLPFTAGSAQGSPSLLEATMMRLKEAQNNRRLSAMNDA